MLKIPIRDRIFSHAKSSSGWLKPTFFEWDYTGMDKDYIFLTDWDVFEYEKYPNLKRYAWLVESPVITPKSYDFVYDNWQQFAEIFTHDKRILERPNAHFLPIGMCHLQEDEIHLGHDKTKLISMMYSGKQDTEGQRLRHSIAKEFNEVVDVMGSGITGKHLKKINSCQTYMYSIAVENCQQDYYFSEKLLDCFLTGTIPIYWGCPSIGNLFNTKGFFIFNTLEELYKILEKQEYLYEFYQINQAVIKENFDLAQKVKIAEDRLFLDYYNMLTNPVVCANIYEK